VCHGAEHGARRPDHIESTAPAAEFDFSEDGLSVINNEIMKDAVMVGGPSPREADIVKQGRVMTQ
jgi:hypothetical protein